MPRTAAPRSDASTRRPTLLPYLYTSNAVLQAYDAFGTVTLVKEGYREMNPFMREMAEHPPAYAALKAGVTLGSMAISERLWKSNHRTAAVATMLLINSTMALVAVNNTRHLQNR